MSRTGVRGTDQRRLAYTLETQLNESDSGQFEVGEQRERNHRYYAMQPLGNEIRGRSHYISPDVLDSVENKKALFKETFLTGRQVVKFKPSGSQLPFEADAKTAYVDMVLQRNHKERLFRDGWHDAFVAKRMVVLATWRNSTRKVTLNVEGANQQQVMMMISQEENVRRVAQHRLQQVAPGIFSGDIQLEVDDSGVELELVQPERYYRDPNADYPEFAMWNTYEEDLSRGDLIDRGYDPDQVERLKMDYRFRSEEEDSSRKAHDQSWTRRRQHKRTREQETVTFYRTWTWLDMDDHDPSISDQIDSDTDGVRLWEIHWSQGEVLYWADGSIAIREVDECGFFEWTEYKIAHAEHGMADADIVSHSQRAQSTLKRLVMDNQQMVNSSRYEAQIGALKNARDLRDNKIGGIIWSRRVGSVKALDTPQLSPLTMSAIGMFAADNDRRSGLSEVAKGMNTDVVRYQNAEGLIDKVTTAGSRRPAGAARDWAQTFLVPLCQYVVRLAMENDKSAKQLEVRGKNLPIVPQQWRDSTLNMAVAKALTPDEGRQHAQMLLGLHQVKAQDPQLSMLYGLAQRHALMDDVYDALGIEDSTHYMMRPDSPQFQQTMRNMQMQQQRNMQMQQQIQQFQQGMMMSADRRAWEEFNWKVTDDMDDNTRQDRELDHNIWKDGEEIDIERNQERAANIGGGNR